MLLEQAVLDEGARLTATLPGPTKSVLVPASGFPTFPLDGWVRIWPLLGPDVSSLWAEDGDVQGRYMGNPGLKIWPTNPNLFV